tara:strand:+ start:4920 stop:6695 length:1776 start_codon:yes stop_codon:yes gene_type:complete
MAGYLGARPVVAQVDGFTKTQSDARYVNTSSSNTTIDGDIINISSDISGGYTGMFNYPFINLKRDVSSTKLGQIDFYGLNSNSNSNVYNSVFANILDNTAGSLKGELHLRTIAQNGTQVYSGIIIDENVNVYSDDSGDTAGPIFNLHRTSASAADDDYIGKINFKGKNDAYQDVDYSSIDVQIDDASDGSEDAITRFFNMSGGSSREHMRFNYQETRFNNAGLDQDFIIESDGRYNFFKVDAALNRLIINANSTTDLASTVTIYSEPDYVDGSDSHTLLTLRDKGNDSSSGPIMDFWRESGSEASNDAIGLIKFSGLNSGNNKHEYARIFTRMQVVTQNSEDGLLDIQVHTDGASKSFISANGSSYIESGQAEVVINEGSADIDFRVEGDSGDRALYVRGSDSKVLLSGDSTNDAGYPVKDVDIIGELRVSTGILFGTDTALANTFYWYEEGSWTPSFQDSQGNTASVDDANGRYTRIGNRIFLDFRGANINTSGLTGSGDLRIYGVPYTPANLSGGSIIWNLGGLRLENVSWASNAQLFPSINENNDFIRIIESISGTADDFITVSQLTSGSADIWGNIVYMTDDDDINP